MWHVYLEPSSLDEALTLLARHAADDGGARIIAGGTDLVIELERGARKAGTLIDISRLPGQDRIWLDEAGWIHLGPLVTHNQVVASPLCVARAFPLARACREVGAPQIRNRGTVAGNLITASPANDTITPLIALGAKVTLRSLRGARAVALRDFYRGARRTEMAADEMMTDIAFPALDIGRQRGTFIKLGLRQAQAISLVNCAAVCAFDDAGHVIEAAIALGAVAPTIVRAAEAEAALIGQPLTDETIAQAAALAQRAASPIDDVRAGAGYRRRMVSALTRRALTQLADGAERDGWNDAPALLWTGDAHRAASPFQPGNPIRLTVNGQDYAINGAQGKTLLRLLREDCGLTGTKEGCAEGECGACTVIMDGQAVMSCLVPAPRAHGARIVTVEGINRLGKGTPPLHPLQQAFIDEGAVQCGYCTPGFIVAGAALLAEYPHPTETQIREGVSGNLCRCTGYYKIISAFDRAIELTSEPDKTHERTQTDPVHTGASDR